MSPPSAFGTYRVLHQIGSGVLGPVFRAYDSERDRLVAIKTFKLDLVPEAASRLADGLRALAAGRPAHPAIVGAVDAGAAGATPFIALEYAAGDALDVLLRQSGPWPLARALAVLRETAAAIDASWGASVGHGALHPRDIFVEAGSAEVRVTGFGIGQALEAAGAKAPVRRPYSAPERGDGAALDIRADVYSLGVVAFELLSGHRPVGSDEEGEAVAPELMPDARAAVRRVIGVAMSDRPADRYDTATAFVLALSGAARVENQESPGRAARINRPRPLALDLPLLQGSDPPEAVRGGAPDVSDGAGAVRSAELGGSLALPSSGRPAAFDGARDRPANGALDLQFDRFEGARNRRVEGALDLQVPGVSELHFRDVSAEAALPERPSPRIDFGRSIPAALPEEPDEPVAAFPWLAVAAVFAAGLVLGGVIMYQLGWTRGGEAARQLAATAASSPSLRSPGAVDAGAAATEPPPAAAPSVSSTPAPAVSPAATPAAPASASGRSPAPPAATGRLVIQSVPSGALVTIDGRRAGETPVTVSVPLGRHEVQVARPGYVPRTERVELTRRSSSRTLRLQLKRGAGGTAPVALAGMRATGAERGGGVTR